MGKKGTRESSLISSQWLIMRVVVGVCFEVKLREGSIALSYEAQHSYLECKRAK